MATALSECTEASQTLCPAHFTCSQLSLLAPSSLFSWGECCCWSGARSILISLGCCLWCTCVVGCICSIKSKVKPGMWVRIRPGDGDRAWHSLLGPVEVAAICPGWKGSPWAWPRLCLHRQCLYGSTQHIWCVSRAHMHVPGRNGHWKAAEKCPEDCCSETSPLLKACNCFLKASVSSKCAWQPRVDVTAEASWHSGAGGVRAWPGCPGGETCGVVRGSLVGWLWSWARARSQALQLIACIRNHFLSFISTVCLQQEKSQYALAWYFVQWGFDLNYTI